MRVSDLAKELGISSEDVLTKLKSLRLKAKDGKQEINQAVLPVLKRALADVAKVSKEAVAEVKETASPQKEISKESKLIKKTKQEKKDTVEKTSIKKTKEAKTAKAAKKKPKPKTVRKKIVKKEKPRSAKKVVPSKKTKIKVVKSKLGSDKGAVAQAEAPLKVKPPKEIFKKEQVKLAPKPPKIKKVKEKLPPSEIVQETAPAQIEEKAKLPLRALEIQLPISVKELSIRMQEKPSIILKKLIQMGIFANINQNLGEDVVKKVAEEFGFSISKVKTQEEQVIDFHTTEKEDPSLLKPRAPVITFMGHVDHGKTSLLDKIRKSKIADKEHGGITQHIGAYSVNLPKGRITFLDTPGHEAFTSMRARGAHITDLVILVVAADEGIMPQTEEAIDHARAANVPIVVALNKIDRKNADVDRVKKQLSKKGLNPEDWGGSTIVVEVSAITGEGVDTLLEMILLEAELLELKANYEKKASGIVVEAKLSRGKGAIATIIVQNGILKEGDSIIVGPYYAKIKAMFDDHERSIRQAGPAVPAEIIGLSGVPEAGEMFYVVDDERQAKTISGRKQSLLRSDKMQSFQKITLEDLYSQIQAGSIKELNIILKADTQGSLEALKDSLIKIPNEELQIKFIHSGIGAINASDIILAVASNAIVMGFNVDMGPRAKEELSKRPVDVRTYRVIYDAIKDIKNALEGLLSPKIKKKFLARVEIREVFKLSRSGIVAGCFVQKGTIHRKVKMDIVRNGEVIFSGGISSLKRFKDDVRDVKEGFECGVTIEGYKDIQKGDIIEAYELEHIARTL